MHSSCHRRSPQLDEVVVTLLTVFPVRETLAILKMPQYAAPSLGNSKVCSRFCCYISSKQRCKEECKADADVDGLEVFFAICICDFKRFDFPLRI